MQIGDPQTPVKVGGRGRQARGGGVRSGDTVEARVDETHQGSRREQRDHNRGGGQGKNQDESTAHGEERRRPMMQDKGAKKRTRVRPRTAVRCFARQRPMRQPLRYPLA